MQREKELQYHVMQCRIRKLSQDQERAEQQLRRTLDFHDQLEQVKKSKQEHMIMKQQWLNEKNAEIEHQRLKNRIDRDLRRQNLNDQKRKLFLKNWHSKVRIKNDTHRLFEVYQAEARSVLEERDARVQDLYLQKRKARQMEVLDYTTNLVNVRQSAELDSLTSLKMCDEYEERIHELEGLEKQKLDDLSHTMR